MFAGARARRRGFEGRRRRAQRRRGRSGCTVQYRLRGRGDGRAAKLGLAAASRSPGVDLAYLQHRTCITCCKRSNRSSTGSAVADPDKLHAVMRAFHEKASRRRALHWSRAPPWSEAAARGAPASTRATPHDLGRPVHLPAGPTATDRLLYRCASRCRDFAAARCVARARPTAAAPRRAQDKYGCEAAGSTAAAAAVHCPRRPGAVKRP